MQLLLIRHAHAGVRGAGPPDDLTRPLSDLGRAQAAAIAATWKDAPLTGVASSRAVRCVDTVVPLAEEFGLAVTTTPELLEGADPATTLAWLERAPAPLAACSHGDVIGGVVQLLHGRGTPLHGGLAWPKASVWALTVTEGRITSGRLHAPPGA